ncbi:hypothetical protein [Colwellia ponticola]|uniref:Uncharacterized protein n=1 Tax=Colwellia ponticola TaxID=2304625 RepID=A0A8H2JNZ3_9GAMM|nr:hypothetical protein [Colwellia ponticola]TMM47682.1 hypothetical protein FCS21_01505 [Colwellia ponticola]
MKKITVNEQLATIIAAHETFYLQASPFNQPGVLTNNAKLPDLSVAFLRSQHQQRLTIYHQLLALDNAQLTQENQINLSVLPYSLKMR